MNEKEYENSLEKLLKTLFKRAERPIAINGKECNELQMVEAIKEVHALLDREKEDTNKKRYSLKKEITNQINKSNDNLYKKMYKSIFQKKNRTESAKIPVNIHIDNLTKYKKFVNQLQSQLTQVQKVIKKMNSLKLTIHSTKA